MSTSSLRLNAALDKRRSQRLMLSVPVRVSGQRDDGTAFEESTATIVVNAHGALAILHETVHHDQRLQVKNLATGEQTFCLAKDVSAAEGGVLEVGLEFTEPQPRFWRVSFPPPDWSSRSPEAKRFSSPAPAPVPVKPAK